VLDAQAYADLVKPSKAVAPFTYRAVAANLFSSIAMPEMSMNDPIRRICLASSRAVQ
jgi:cytochrome o ubiquinol oxidase subunit 2